MNSRQAQCAPAAQRAEAPATSARFAGRPKRRFAALAPLVVLAFALLSVPAASAERSILSQFDAPNPFPKALGDSSFSLGSMAVADSGGAWAEAGDVYFGGLRYLSNSCGGFGSCGGFVEQLAPSSELKRVWGADIVASGPGDADETQAVRVIASGGTFTLSFGGDSTPALDFDADPDTGPGNVQDALNALPSVSAAGGSVSVGGGPGDAVGSTPYLVTFDGGPLHGTDQPLLLAGGTGLGGGTAAVYTTNPGHTGFEICEPDRGDVCSNPRDLESGALSLPQGAERPGVLGNQSPQIALDQANGDILAYTALRRINRYSSTGRFLRAFGFDVVRQGPGDSSVDETQELTVSPSASGSYTLSLTIPPFGGTQTTDPIPVGAPAATVKTAIEALPELTSKGGSVDVSGPDGGPYTIVFAGSFAGDALDQFSASPSLTAAVITLQNGGGPEVCAAGDACKIGVEGNFAGATSGFPRALTVAPPAAPDNGNVLLAGPNRVDEFSGEGEFVRAFGWDVVKSGPDQVAAPDEIQQVTVKADGGTFTLGYRKSEGGGGNTAPIPFDASPAEVKSALEAISSLGGAGGTVTVAGGPGDLGGNNPYTITFGGSLAGDGVPQMTSSEFGLSGPRTVTLHNATGGTFTLSFPSFGGSTTAPIPFNASAGTVQSALEALSTIGTGNVSVTGSAGGPWTVTFTGALAGTTSSFSADGSALSGYLPTATATRSPVAVTTLTQGGAFEVCKGGTADVCGVGSVGPRPGQVNGTPISLAEDNDGVIYEVSPGFSFGSGESFSENDALLGSVQRFSPAVGLDLTPSVVGVNETQQLNVNAAAGQFRLTAIREAAAVGTAKNANSSPLLTDVVVNQGVFLVGQRINNGPNGGGTNPLGTTITSVDPLAHTITLSGPFACGDCSIFADMPVSTPDLPFDAPAAQVQAATDDLPTTDGEDASVHVSGPDGGPYTIVFDGGSAPRTDFAQLGTEQGTVPLSGGSGPGANQATVSTLGDGGPGGRSAADAPLDVGVLPNGDPVVAKSFPEYAGSCPAGSPFDLSFAETRIQEFSPDGLTLLDASPPCNIAPGYFSGDRAERIDLGVGAIDPSSGEIYAQTLFKAADRDAFPHVQPAVIGEVGPPAEFLPLDPVSGLTATSATIAGEIDPNGPGTIAHPSPSLTRYVVEYRKVGDSNWTRFVSGVPVGSGDSPVSFTIAIGGLVPKTTYEARVLAVKPFGFAPLIQATAPFTTEAGTPRIESPFFDNLTASSADLHAEVNPSGADTAYRFEYGTTIAYGQSTPLVAVGDGVGPVAVQAHISGLDGAVYHFRVVATNSVGTTTGPDQTFNFYPEPCPNAAVRQQTGSTLLPDCRAYELVSPGAMGTIALNLTRAPASSLASNPPRFVYGGLGGVLPGPWNPPNTGGNDYYVATRTGSGWQSRFVGIEAQDGGGGSYPGAGPNALVGDQGFDRFLQWGLNTARTGSSSAPYLFDAEGSGLGRLPTNLEQFPGGDLAISSGGFVGAQLLSGDGRHLFYSSAIVPLAPGGLSSGAGSVYRNDIDTGAVSIVSKTESGLDIPPAPGPANPGHFLLLAEASTDGSHALIAAPTGCSSSLPPNVPCPSSPAVLYMRVDDHSFDVSEGRAVDFQGMTRDGSRAFFTSAEQLVGNDHDSSQDLYMWSEAGDTLTRVSAGTDPIGATDNCSASWISGCGVQVVPHDNGSQTKAATDNAVAAAGEAAYFYSPEQLAGSDGFPGRRNLYAYRDGAIHFVAALDADKPASRIQVSADGRFAAFITRTRLTTYDNDGHAEMYRYDDADGSLVCVSCDPMGVPPSHDVQASSNGLFVSDNGRAFFATLDPLVPLDADGLLDVYEFVDGRAQLITTGVAATTDPGVGLVGVSADGADVYFVTLETLVAQDKNGPFPKFYDARTNGGFPVAAQILPCAAAEECHGAASAPPPPPNSHSSANLGNVGNAPVRNPCRKGKVRKQGRCVARHPHKKRHRHHPHNGEGAKR